MKAQAVISLYSLLRDNVLKWGTDAESKWVDLKPLGHCPPSCGCVCVIASTPTLIDSLCRCLIMVWVFFPGTEKLPYPQARRLAVTCGGRNVSRNVELKCYQMRVYSLWAVQKKWLFKYQNQSVLMLFVWLSYLTCSLEDFYWTAFQCIFHHTRIPPVILSWTRLD